MTTAIYTTSDDVEEPKSLCGFLSITEIEQLNNLTLPEVELKLATKLQIENYPTSLKSGILLDYYVSGICFARENQFNTHQVDLLFCAMQSVIEKCKQGISKEDSFKTLKDVIPVKTDDCHAAAPSAAESSETKISLMIVDYLLSTFFRHHKLYQCMFTEEQEEIVVTRKLLVESLPVASTPFPAPLDEGMSKELYERFVAPPPVETCEKTDAELDKVDEEVTDTPDDSAVKRENFLSSLDPDTVKNIISEIASKKMEDLKTEYRKRLKDKEAALLGKSSKLNVKWNS